MDKTCSLILDLPFHKLESYLRLYTQPSHQNSSWPKFTAGPSTIDPRLTLNGADAEDSYLYENIGFVEASEDLEQQPSFEVTSRVHTASELWTPDSSVLTALKSVVPRSMAAEYIPGSSVMSPSTQIFTSSLHRQTLFSVANNFAGLDSFPIKDIIHFLQEETNESFNRLVRSDRSYSSRMILQNIFKAAIEVGDARIVDVLIGENPKDIKVNEPSCFVNGRRYTPIERASMLRYADVVDVLLKHSADVNRIDLENDGSSHGALDYAVYGIDDGGALVFDPHPQIFQTLLKAGGDLSTPLTRTLVASGDGKLVHLFMSANAPKKATEWNEHGVFCDAMMFLDDHTSMEVVRIMLECGVDLNSQVGIQSPQRPGRVIDAAAQRGNLGSVILLLDSGALLTGDTFPCAIESGNQELILFLLTKGADVNSIGSLRVTPLAAAIRLQDAYVLEMIEERGAWVIPHRQEHFTAALEAASEVGNIQYIERLIQLGGKVSPKGLGYALLIATRDGWDEVAKTLIDSGANVNVHSGEYSPRWDEPPLFHALKRRQEALVLSLLDADADPNLSGIGAQSMVIAAEWGNRSVIETLIFAGADVNACPEGLEANFKGCGPERETALTIAVKRQDRELIQLLLAHGANLNDPRHHGGTALHAAAENGDIEMAGFLLHQGADPKDSSAFTATFENEKLFDLLFEKCCARYPMSWGECGAEILAKAIAKGNERVIKLMLQTSVNTNVMTHLDGQWATPFGHAIVRQQSNFTGLLELFLQNGCNPNDVVSQTWNGFDGSSPPVPSRHRQNFPFVPLRPVNYPRLRATALLAAIGMRNTSTVELFIRYGADVNYPTRGPLKRTSLQRAAEIGCLDIVELLINHGANVHTPAAERGGGTALQLAAIGGYIPLACRLLSLKADVNAPRSKVDGRTALEGAAEHGRLDMVKLLLNGGGGSDHGGEEQIANAIGLARDNGHYPICDLLEFHLFSRRQGSGRETPADANNGESIDRTLDDDPFSLVSFEGAE